MPGAALLFGKQPGILNRDSQLTGGSLHDLKIPGQKLRFRSVLIAAITPTGLPPRKIGTPQNDRAGRGGIKSNPSFARVCSRSDSISSGCPVLMMCSVNPLLSLRERLGRMNPPSISSSKKISSSS